MREKIKSIQALRGMAAALVVLFHTQMLVHVYEGRYGLPASPLTATETIRLFGQCGVDLFFVISGFVMAYITFGSYGRKGAAGAFLKRRAARIIPLYWLYTSVMAILLLALPQLFATATFELRGLVLSYLFIPYTPSGLNMAPMLAVGWTLSYEFYFYLLLAVGLSFFSRLRFLICLGCFFALAVFTPARFPGPIAHLLTNPLLFEFYAGYLLGTAYKKGFSLPPRIAVLCIAGAIILLVLGIMAKLPHVRIFSWGLPSALLLAGIVSWEKTARPRFPEWFSALGDSSYTLYLSHPLLLPGIGKLCAFLGVFTAFPSTVFIVFAVILCCAAGHVLYLLVEKPLLRVFLHDHAGRKEAARSEAAKAI